MRGTALASLIIATGLLWITAAAAAPAAMMRGPMSIAPGHDLVQGRACRACRNDCYARYRMYCGNSEGCRRAFTLCMRDCWDAYCR